MKKAPVILLASFLLFTLFVPFSNAASKCAVHGALPDKACTPGAVFAVTAAQVCTSGYSKSVRNVSTATKNAVYAAYDIISHSATTYEMDHFIPLELGGSNVVKNLFPEAALPKPGFHEKDKVENYLHTQVCSGKMTLATAQKAITTNWVSVYNKIKAVKQPAQAATIKATPAPKKVTTTKTTTSITQPAVKMSTSGLCHAKGSKYYAQTKTYKSFSSIKACLSSGGKLPK